WEYSRLADEPESDKITARIVLSHTSGLPNWTNPRGDDLYTAFEPGTDYRYSGEGYLYLQRVLEHLTDKTLMEIAKEEVFEPHGMNKSHFIYTYYIKEYYAHGHNELEPMSIRKIQNPNAAYSLITSAEDYAIFIQKALIVGEGLEPQTHKAMLDSTSRGSSGVGYGLGIQMQHNEKGEGIM